MVAVAAADGVVGDAEVVVVVAVVAAVVGRRSLVSQFHFSTLKRSADVLAPDAAALDSPTP